MENLYGIGITNRYQLFLNEDEDPLEVLKVQEQEKELKKKSKLSEKENKGKQQEPKGKPVVNIRKGIKETQNIKSQDQQHKVKEETVKLRGPPRTTTERKFNNENREERNNQRNRPEKPGGPGGDFHREERGEKRFERRPPGPGPEGDGPRGEGGRGRPLGTGRGMGRGRGRGGRGGFDGRGKREFDRQSGSDKTGIKAVDKREGAGAHNWGSHRDAIDDLDNINRQADDSGDWGDKIDNDVSITEPTTEPKEATEGQNGVEGEEGETPANVEEERKELTLDEWKALKGNRSKPQYNLRKAGEGEDLTQWKKMYALQKKKEEEEEEDDEEYDSSDYPQRVGRQKHILDIEFTFADGGRIGGRGRGGRGAGRGAPRGGSRGGPPRGTSSDNGPVMRDPEREPGTYGGPRNSRQNAPKPRDREREPGSYGGPGPRTSTRQSAPKVDDEHDFPSLG